MEKNLVKTALPCSFSIMFLLVLPAWAGDTGKDVETLKNAATVLEAMIDSKSVPADVLAKANCILVLPNVKKVGFGVGGSGGRGPLTCRGGKDFKGKWSAPAMYSVGGVSAGFQVGVSSSDFVLLLMDEKGVSAIMRGKTKLGKDATAAAGPGATAQAVTGDIYTYGRAKGLFAGVSLGSASIDPDTDANARLYGKPMGATEIIEGGAKPPAGAEPLIELLNSKAGQ